MKKPSYSHIRQLVLYKQMLATLNKGKEVLDVIEQHYFQATRDSETDERFDAHVEKLLKFHEHVLLKFENKLKADTEEASRVDEENDVFMHTVMEAYTDRRDDLLRLSIVAAVIYDYGFQIGRLNRLVEHYSKATDDKDELGSGKK
ncbi:hypothetical protein D3C73_731010 [compost metagenome]